MKYLLNYLLFLSCALLFTTSPAAASNITATILERGSTSWDGVDFAYPEGTPEITIQKITIQSNGQEVALPVHCHPMPLGGYVLKGSVRVKLKTSGKSRLFQTGESLIEVSNTWHHGVFTEDTELLIFYAGKTDLPLTIKEGEETPLSAKCR